MPVFPSAHGPSSHDVEHQALATVTEEDETAADSSVQKQHHLVVDVFSVDEEDGTWRQKSRFAKYEEDSEGFDQHFGKAHVPFNVMGTYQALQQVIPKSILLSDVDFKSEDDFCSTLERTVIDNDHPSLGLHVANMVRTRIASLEKSHALNKVHSTSTQSLHGRITRKTAGDGQVGITRSMISAPHDLRSLGISPPRRLPTTVSGLRLRGSFFREPEVNSHPLEPVVWDEANELSMLVTGVVPELSVCRFIAVRFKETTSMKSIFPKMENIRHIFFLIGPKLEEVDYLDMGRALAAVAANPTHLEAFDTIKSPESILRAIERFLSNAVVIAPGKIDNKNLVAPDLIRKMVNTQAEKHSHHNALQHVYPKTLDVEKNVPQNLEKEQTDSTSWLFSGAKKDVRERFRHFLSDFGDGVTPLSIIVVVYMVCVTVVPTLTFGAILAIGTEGVLAVKECLLGQLVCGLLWSFLSCQPLLVMSPTGPFLVFEKALYQFTMAQGLDFLEVRLYTGFFVLLYSILGSAFNIARLIKYVTAYTEDIFCALISMIFIYEVYEFLENQNHHNKIQDLAYYVKNAANCTGIPDEDCPLSRPNSFLLQLIMVVASIAIFHYLRQLSRSSFFGRNFRTLCRNFGGTFSVVVVTVIYYIFFRDVEISTVNIPVEVGENRHYGFIVIPSEYPSGMTIGISAIAGLLLFVLLFVETEIPEQMALRESRKLKKGGGLHWDLMVAGFCTVVCSVMGLPWQCPAAVQSLAHITALTVYKKSAPGEPNRPDHVVEQRVTGIATYLCLGSFLVFGHYVEIPSAAIFGVFFYLGILNLNGNMLLTRNKLMFLLPKYRGNHKFLELAPFYVIILFTWIQNIALLLMFAAKSTQIGGICFPVMLVAVCFFRNLVLPLLFTKELLAALDSEDFEEEEEENEDDENPVDFYYNTRIPV